MRVFGKPKSQTSVPLSSTSGLTAAEQLFYQLMLFQRLRDKTIKSGQDKEKEIEQLRKQAQERVNPDKLTMALFKKRLVTLEIGRRRAFIAEMVARQQMENVELLQETQENAHLLKELMPMLAKATQELKALNLDSVVEEYEEQLSAVAEAMEELDRMSGLTITDPGKLESTIMEQGDQADAHLSTDDMDLLFGRETAPPRRRPVAMAETAHSRPMPPPSAPPVVVASPGPGQVRTGPAAVKVTHTPSRQRKPESAS